MWFCFPLAFFMRSDTKIRLSTLSVPNHLSAFENGVPRVSDSWCLLNDTCWWLFSYLSHSGHGSSLLKSDWYSSSKYSLPQSPCQIDDRGELSVLGTEQRWLVCQNFWVVPWGQKSPKWFFFSSSAFSIFACLFVFAIFGGKWILHWSPTC